MELYYMLIRISLLLAVSLMLLGCAREYLPKVDRAAADGDYAQAAKRLGACANTHKGDGAECKLRYEKLISSGLPLALAVEYEHKGILEEKVSEYREMERQKRIHQLRTSEDPWDKYLLFSELVTGNISPINDSEINDAAKAAFNGFSVCAKNAEPSCMNQYAEMIMMGIEKLDGAASSDAKTKAMYWLKLAARYGHEQARRNLISLGEEVPTPDLAMERLQKDANAIAANAILSQERARREQAAREYELIREVRRQTEAQYWQNLFPKVVRCSSNVSGAYTYTSCW